MKENDGKIIVLYFEDEPEYVVLKGWHCASHCDSEIFKEYGDEAKKVKVTEHIYGFWGFGYDECGNRIMFLYFRKHPKRGRFKITLAHFV